MSTVNLLCGVIRNISPSAQIFAHERGLGTDSEEINKTLSRCIASAKTTASAVMQHLRIPANDKWSKQCIIGAILQNIAQDWPKARSSEIDSSQFLRHYKSIQELELAPDAPEMWDNPDFAPTFIATAMGAAIQVSAAYLRFNFFQIDQAKVTERVMQELIIAAHRATDQVTDSLIGDDLARQQVTQSFLKSGGRMFAATWDAKATDYLLQISNESENQKISFVRSTSEDRYESLIKAFHETMDFCASSVKMTLAWSPIPAHRDAHERSASPSLEMK